VKDETQCPFQAKIINCIECQDATETFGDKRINYIISTCRERQIRKNLLKKSGLFGKDVFETFANAKRDKHNSQLYQYLQKEWDRKTWLYIFSQENGTGKSYTANAIGNMLIDSGNQPLVIREIDMAAELKASFEDKTGDSEYAVMGRFKAVPVLIVQDFGKHGSKTEWWPQKIYDIIDHRLITGKTTVFTSNFDVGDWKMIEKRFGDNHGPAIYSRLNGICELWEMSGPDRRNEKAVG